MNIAAINAGEIKPRLVKLYGAQANRAYELLLNCIDQFVELQRAPDDHVLDREPWDQTDVVLITYGDQIQSRPAAQLTAEPADFSNHDDDPSAKLSSLATLRTFLRDWQLSKLINTIHFLPFFPSSSDDGFSVIDYRTVDRELGDWDDVHQFRDDFHLMFDFVVNHASQESSWFQSYLAGVSPYDQFFIEANATEDWSRVTRPRSLPLLHDFETSRGTKSIWTTFSRDQVDLNYAHPEVMAAAVSILLEYVQQGARIIRLDAIAYLWKRPGTSCIHLPETHEFVKLMRDVLQVVAPQVLLLTETNVPHEENVSYFGEGDEAQMVYQFSLPPLLLDAFLHHDAAPLKRWLARLESPPRGTTYFNFTASHDGIGVRPLEGHVNEDRLRSLVEKIQQRGGHVSTRRQSDGSDSPYELNISYLDALADEQGNSELQVRRFLATQAVMLALQGMPAIYFHSLVGTPSDHEGVERSGIPRRINRRKYEREALNQILRTEGSRQQQVFRGIQRLLQIRVDQPAFHPNAAQRYVETDQDGMLAFERHCAQCGQRILVVVNFGAGPAHYQPPPPFTEAVDLFETNAEDSQNGQPRIWQAAQVRWLVAED